MADEHPAADPGDPSDPADPTVAASTNPPDEGPAGPATRPAERLRARAAATDRAGRFELRLQEVRRLQARRRRVRRLVRIGWACVFAALGGLAPIVVAAVLSAADPSGRMLLLGAAIGAVVGALGPSLRNRVARRRGARAWDAYNDRYVLLGEPASNVHDADRPGPDRGGSARPPPQR